MFSGRKRKEIILGKNKNEVLEGSVNSVQLFGFSIIFAFLKKVIKTAGRFAAFPIMLAMDWAKACNAAYEAYHSTNKSLNVLLRVAVEFAKAIAFTVAVLGSFISAVFAAAVTPWVFFITSVAGTVYSLFNGIHSMFKKWGAKKDSAKELYYKNDRNKSFVGAAIGLVVSAAIFVIMIFQLDKVFAFGSLVASGIIGLCSGISTFFTKKAKKEKEAEALELASLEESEAEEKRDKDGFEKSPQPDHAAEPEDRMALLEKQTLVADKHVQVTPDIHDYFEDMALKLNRAYLSGGNHQNGKDKMKKYLNTLISDKIDDIKTRIRHHEHGYSKNVNFLQRALYDFQSEKNNAKVEALQKLQELISDGQTSVNIPGGEEVRKIYTLDDLLQYFQDHNKLRQITESSFGIGGIGEVQSILNTASQYFERADADKYQEYFEYHENLVERHGLSYSAQAA